jgi:hypothetical protein
LRDRPAQEAFEERLFRTCRQRTRASHISPRSVSLVR